jgi:hypothetical protein
MSYLSVSKTSPFSFINDAGAVKGSELTELYLANPPFPHIEIENFLPKSLLEYCLDNFPVKLDSDGRNFDRSQERYKAAFNPDGMEPGIKSLFYAFNSRPFVSVLENITGIKGLIPDPYFAGAGLHEIGQGGHLSIHADFNHHQKLNLERRINVLIYLNKDWQASYGGQLELWDSKMLNCVKSIIPEFNKAVIFNTTSNSWHGNPEVVNHPKDINRRSIALYYYTATWPDNKREQTTQFKIRPESSDKIDWKVKREEWLKEYLPPFISRRLLNILHRF